MNSKGKNKILLNYKLTGPEGEQSALAETHFFQRLNEISRPVAYGNSLDKDPGIFKLNAFNPVSYHIFSGINLFWVFDWVHIELFYCIYLLYLKERTVNKCLHTTTTTTTQYVYIWTLNKSTLHVNM